MRKQLFFTILYLGICATLFPFHTAHAYLDPNTGSYFFQILIGLFFGGLYVVQLFWRRIVRGAKRLFFSKPKEEEA